MGSALPNCAYLGALVCVAMGYLGRQRSSRQAPFSSGRRLSLVDRDEGPTLERQPSSRHHSLLAAAGIGGESSLQRSGPRRSPAAHTKRSLSRAQRAGEKIRLLDGIGGFSPHGTMPRQDDGYSTATTRWFRKHLPSAGQLVLVTVLVAAIVALASYPEIITTGRYAMSSLIAKTVVRSVAERSHINPDETHDGHAHSNIHDDVSDVGAPLGPFDEPCVRLIAGQNSISSELITLVHAAKHFREQGKEVVWDFGEATATCSCGGLDEMQSSKKSDKSKLARRLLGETTSTSFLGSDKCTRASTNNGWHNLFDSDSKTFISRTNVRLGGSCASVDARAAVDAIGAMDGSDSIFEVGSGNAMCDDVVGAWRLTETMEAAVTKEITEKLGGDVNKVVAFHVGNEKSNGNSRDTYAAHVEKEVLRLGAFMRENGATAVGEEGWSARADAYESEVNSIESKEEGKSNAHGHKAREEHKESTHKESTPSKATDSKSKHSKTSTTASDENMRAYVESAMRDLEIGQKETGSGKKVSDSKSSKLAKSPRDEPTLMDQFAGWLKKRDDKSGGGARRLLGVTTDADAGAVAATKLEKTDNLFESATDVAPVEQEDFSLLERVGRRFESFKLELAAAKANRANDAEDAAREQAETEQAKAEVLGEIERAVPEMTMQAHVETIQQPNELEIAKLSGQSGWRCVIVGRNAAMARRVASAIEKAQVPCVVVDRVRERTENAKSNQCANTVADVVDAELAARAKRAAVNAPADGARLAALLQQCREDRLDMNDWAGLGVHELSVSSKRN